MRSKEFHAPGEVLQIRVNTKDMMTAIDLVEGSGAAVDRYSLAMIVSQAFKGMCTFARDKGLNGVKEREGYEYLNMTEKYRTGIRQGAKIHASLEQEQQDYSRMNMNLDPVSIPVVEDDPAIKRKRTKFEALIKELVQKKQVDPDNFGPDEEAQLLQARKDFGDTF